jgi:hypothetical protein
MNEGLRTRLLAYQAAQDAWMAAVDDDPFDPSKFARLRREMDAEAGVLATYTLGYFQVELKEVPA